MINLHFFGCSLTAGDELSDEEFFPWKATCNNPEEYYNRRNKFLLDNNFSAKYERSNLALAYPALVENEFYKTYNYAKNGSSLKENIFRVLKLIYENNDIGVIFLQIPPPGREMYIKGKDFVTTLRFTDAKTVFTNEDKNIDRYIKSKVMSHGSVQYSLEDVMDLLMISNLAKQRNIKLFIINLTNQLEFRLNDLNKVKEFQSIHDNLLKDINLIKLPQHLRSQQTLAGHLNKLCNREFAELIQAMLPDILNLQA